MALVAKLLIALVALLHVYFLILEMFLWTRPAGLRVFRMTPEKARETSALAANQGLYNGFLVAGLIWSLAHPDPAVARQLALFFLGCVLVAGLYGAYSVNLRIFLIQGLPALLAIAILELGSR